MYYCECVCVLWTADKCNSSSLCQVLQVLFHSCFPFHSTMKEAQGKVLNKLRMCVSMFHKGYLIVHQFYLCPCCCYCEHLLHSVLPPIYVMFHLILPITSPSHFFPPLSPTLSLFLLIAARVVRCAIVRWPRDAALWACAHPLHCLWPSPSRVLRWWRHRQRTQRRWASSGAATQSPTMSAKNAGATQAITNLWPILA